MTQTFTNVTLAVVTRPLGAEDFLDWILERVQVENKEGHSRRENDETEQGKALRIVRSELRRLGWSETELQQRRKGDPQKVALAARLRSETAVTLKWIAQTLHMGTPPYVANRLYCERNL